MSTKAGITWAGSGRGFEGMTESELRTLEDARVQAGKLARIRARCSVIAPKGAYKSPSLTGMPRGNSEPCGLDGSRQECEKLLQELETEERRYAEVKKACERILKKSTMKPELREFCRLYYLRRMSVEQAAESMGMAGRTGWNYKGKIEAARKAKKPCHKRENRAENDQKNFQ